jgi:hypothetical protein
MFEVATARLRRDVGFEVWDFDFPSRRGFEVWDFDFSHRPGGRRKLLTAHDYDSFDPLDHFPSLMPHHSLDHCNMMVVVFGYKI